MKKAKLRLTIYLDSELHRWLWTERVRTGAPVSEIAESLMVSARRARDRKDRRARLAVPVPEAG